MCEVTRGRVIDIEELERKYDKVKRKEFEKPSLEDALALQPMLETLVHMDKLTDKEFTNLTALHNVRGKKRSYFLQAYRELVDCGIMSKLHDNKLRSHLRIKNCKSFSGVVVVTVFTSGEPEYTDESGEKRKQMFSCQWNCSFCPNEPNQPRSYLKLENGVLRANRNNFDCYAQMTDRLTSLYSIGHDVDKLEIIISGGTFSSYPHLYREEFIRDIFYASNVFWDKDKRARLSLDKEKELNKAAKTRVIGITIETRPDCIVPTELQRYRRWEITRVQIGLQHLDQDVLDKNNRGCTTLQAKRAIKLLKDCCFKIDIHVMLNLPFTTPEKDRHMLEDRLLGLRSHIKRKFGYPSILDWFKGNYNEVLEEWDLAEPDFSAEQWKLYPCMITPWTDIEKWYREGTYVPYPEKHMRDVLIRAKSIMYPFIRINRVIRDFPEGDYDVTGGNTSNMRNDIKRIMDREGTKCACIRCREPKDNEWDGTYTMVLRKYPASDGIEYFVSAESRDQETIYGFVRLRIPSQKINETFPELSFCALVRELHVYGRVETVAPQLRTSKSNVQHRGIGKVLMGRIETIAKEHGYYKMAVIAGCGVKPYYAKLGYREENYFMTKTLVS